MSNKVLLITSEKHFVKIGSEFFFHSNKESSYCVDLSWVRIMGPSWIQVDLGREGGIVNILGNELREFQFV